MKKNNIALLGGVFVFSLLSLKCTNNNPVAIDITKLSEYYETDAIKLKNISGEKLELTISESPFIKHNQKQSSHKWSTMEPYGSMGALIVSDEAKKNSLDSIIVRIKNDGSTEIFRYSVDHLIKVKEYNLIANKFITYWNKGDVEKSKEFLTNEVLKVKDLIPKLKAVIPEKLVIDRKLIAVTTSDGQAGLYINLYFGDDDAQTYIFVFLFDNESKIAGIQPYKIDD